MRAKAMLWMRVAAALVAAGSVAVAQEAPPARVDAAASAMQAQQAEALTALKARGVESPAGMLLIPAGEFLMGSSDADPLARPEEKPQRKVYMDAYWIDRSEVSVAEYWKFCAATGRPRPSSAWWAQHPFHPVMNVSKADAEAYAVWVGKRLPTEAEWEKAARGTDGRTFPWGEEWPPKVDVGNLGFDIPGYSDGALHLGPVAEQTVGPKPYVRLGSAWGALEMAGNVWEWVADRYAEDAYRAGPTRNPKGPEKGEMGIVRGGAWYVNCSEPYRCAARFPYDPAIRTAHVGFRCAKDVGT